MTQPYYRYNTVRYNYTWGNRVRLWWVGVWNAVCTLPPHNGIYWQLLRPGDPGYEDALYAAAIDPEPYRVDLELEVNTL